MTSIRARCLNGLLKITVRRQIKRGVSLDEFRRHSARTDARLGGKIGQCTAEAVVGAPVPTLRIAAPGCRPDRVILYFHGGGFCMHMPNAYKRLAAKISEHTGAVTYLVDYRLAPEHPISACFDDAIASYRWLLDQGRPASSIVIAGDSAGGGLTLGTGQRARDGGLPLPSGLIMLSPGLDATFESASMRENDGKDPMFRYDGLCYLRDLTLGSGENPADPAVSPGRGSFAGLPPMRFDVSTTELLRDDSRMAVKKAREQGSEAVLREWPATAHVFQIAPWVPETRKWLLEASQFAKQCWEKSNAGSDSLSQNTERA